MGDDILNKLSTNELQREIQKLTCEDQRALPSRSKIFAAIAKLQKFDVLPEAVEIADINKAVQEGCIELNRGISGTKGVPSQLYARALIFGALYPGTLSAKGNGIYFAVPSQKDPKFEPIFPIYSSVAIKYTAGETSGILLRAALKKDIKVADCDDLRDLMRENKNRAKRAGITDLGAFAAALGFDAFYEDNLYDDTGERIYTVLNRGALLIQKAGVLVQS